MRKWPRWGLPEARRRSCSEAGLVSAITVNWLSVIRMMCVTYPGSRRSAVVPDQGSLMTRRSRADAFDLDGSSEGLPFASETVAAANPNDEAPQCGSVGRQLIEGSPAFHH